MKFNPHEVLVDYEGKEIKNETGQAIDWKTVIFTACNAVSKDEVLTNEQKISAYQITTKVFNAKDEAELTINQLNFVLGRIKSIYSPLIIGRALEKFDTLPKEE